MSLILEALKKSEQQRQREKAPSLQSIHQPVPVAVKKPVQPWWWLAAFVVICNLTFLGYWFWREQDHAARTAQTTTASAVTGESTAPAVNANQPAAAQDGEGAVRKSEVPQNAQPEFTQISPRGIAAQPVTADTLQRVYEINELPENVRNNLPAMTFSFHVYSENPEQRTIIINDRRIREGEEVGSGLRLEAITQDGVILFFQQHRIHISVLSDW